MYSSACISWCSWKVYQPILAYKYGSWLISKLLQKQLQSPKSQNTGNHFLLTFYWLLLRGAFYIVVLTCPTRVFTNLLCFNMWSQRMFLCMLAWIFTFFWFQNRCRNVKKDRSYTIRNAIIFQLGRSHLMER